jgi:hypothetical protein
MPPQHGLVPPTKMPEIKAPKTKTFFGLTEREKRKVVTSAAKQAFAEQDEMIKEHEAKQKAPNCYDCKFRREVPGDAHSSCANGTAEVTCDQHGKKNGWFNYPWNFDPIWLKTCDGFEPKK